MSFAGTEADGAPKRDPTHKFMTWQSQVSPGLRQLNHSAVCRDLGRAGSAAAPPHPGDAACLAGYGLLDLHGDRGDRAVSRAYCAVSPAAPDAAYVRRWILNAEVIKCRCLYSPTALSHRVEKASAGVLREQLAVVDYLSIGLALNAYRSLALAGNGCRFVEAFHALTLKDYRRLRCSSRS